MDLVLYIVTWPLRLFWKIGLGSAMLFCALFFTGIALIRLRDDEAQLGEDLSDEQIEALAEYAEDDDMERRGYADMDPIERAAAIQEAFRKQMFVPTKPFIPWWIQARKGQRE